jgi:hypothetical protein
MYSVKLIKARSESCCMKAKASKGSKNLFKLKDVPQDAY